MDPITILSIITVTGIILLLGLFGACLGYAYLSVRAASGEATRQGETKDRSADESAVGDTGDFVFGPDHETTESADPRQQL
jgi:beta-lactamase regulating signal transducer with metallopeptidase domain